MYDKESHRFQKLDDILQDELMAATVALSLLARRCVKPYIFTPHLHKAGYTIRDEHAARTTITMKFHQKSKRVIIADN